MDQSKAKRPRRPEVDNLDIRNVIEADKIRTLLVKHPDLLSFFEILIIMCNNRLNDEKVVKNIDKIIDEALEEEYEGETDSGDDEDLNF
jgi:hypothetical protein